MFQNKFYWFRSEVCPEIGKIKLFQTYFLKILKAPLSDLSWKTEISMPIDLRGGALSIRRGNYPLIWQHCNKIWKKERTFWCMERQKC